MNKQLLWLASIPVLIAAPAQAQTVSVTDVRLETTPSGLQVQVILETATGETPQTFTTSSENSLLIDVVNAQLALPGEAFEALSPTADITSVTVNQLDENTVRVTVVGETGVPTAEVVPVEGGLILSVIPPAELETLELVVTATRTEEPLEEIPRSVTVIEREQIERQANLTRDLGEILGKTVPGLAPPTQTSSIFGQPLRGRDISVLIDGVPQGTNRNAQRDLRTIDPSAVERIEVIRGPSAIYGNGATGGVINIITRRSALEPFAAKTGIGVEGSLNHFENSLGFSSQQYLSGNFDRFDYVLSSAFVATGGFFDAEGDRIPPDPQNQGGLANLDTWNLLGKFTYNFDEQQRLQFSVNYFDEGQDSDFTTDPTPEGDKAEAREGLELSEQPESENTVVNLDYTHDSLLGSRVHGQLYYRDYLTRFSPFDLRASDAFGNTVLQSRVESEKIGGRLDIDTPLVGEETLSVLWGVDYFHEDSSQPADLFDTETFAESDGLVFEETGAGFLSPPIEQDNLGLFAEVSWKPSDRLTFRGGIRQEFIGVSLDNFTTLAGNEIDGGDLDYDATLFNIGAIYSVTNEVSLFASFAQGFSIADVARALRTAPAGSEVEDLSPEAQEVDNFELGLRGDWRNVQASIAAFYNTSDLGTTFDAEFNTIRDPQQIYGVEATIDTQIGANWQLGGGFTWTEGDRDIDDDDDFETPLPNFQIPPVKLTAYIENQTAPGWRNRFQVLYSGERDPEGEGFGLDEIDSYFTADLISSIDVGSGVLELSIENIFNELYFPNISQVFGGISRSAARGARFNINYTVNW